MKNVTTSIFFSLFLVLSSFSQEIKPIIIDGKTQGTSFHIIYLDKEQRNLEDEIIAILISFENSLSTYIPNSTISKVNKNHSKYEIDPYFEYCFKKSKEYWKMTNGAFDPTVYPLNELWGFGESKHNKADKNKIDSVLTFVGFDKVNLVDGKIIKSHPSLKLDFNGCAQGYSVDVISNYLLSKNISQFIVEIGGELYANGKMADGSNWLVGIETPIEAKQDENSLQLVIAVEGKGVATSGSYRKYQIVNGKKYSHIIDPISGEACYSDLLSATVVMDDCIGADAIATALIVMGLEKSISFLKEHSEIDAYFIYTDENGNFKSYQTPGFSEHIIEIVEN